MDDYAKGLADAVDAVLPRWVERCVTTVMTAWRGSVPPEVADAAVAAGLEARAIIGAAVRELVGRDIDDQRGTPLTLLRAAVRYPTAVLAAAGVPHVERDRWVTDTFPDDVYDLHPATWADVDPDLADPGLAWSASKAFEHRRRHLDAGPPGQPAQPEVE